MRRITVLLGVCAVAAASTAIAAGGGSAKVDHAPRLANRYHRLLLPGVRYLVLPSVQGNACYVSSAEPDCSLTPCRGFVATGPDRVVVTGGADWVPITPQCRGRRSPPLVRVSPRGGQLPLVMGALRYLPSLVSRPR